MDKIRNKMLIDVAKTLIQNNGGMPMTFIGSCGTRKNPISYTAEAHFSNIKEKERIVKAMFTINTLLGIKEYYLLTEGWTLPMEQKEDDREIRLHFQKKSALLILHATKDSKIGSMTPYKKILGNIIFEDSNIKGECDFGGLMSHLTSFSHDSEKEIMEILDEFKAQHGISNVTKKELLDTFINAAERMGVVYQKTPTRLTKKLFY